MKKLYELEQTLQKNIDDLVVPGFVYGVITASDNYCGSVGYSQLVPTKNKISEQYLYDIASLTKVISTVTIICRLVEKGKISFNDSVKKYLHNFKYDDITIYNLLVHNSGLPADLGGKKEIVSKDEIIRQIYLQDKEYDTSSDVLYSDLGYMLLGLIIEKVCNKSLDEVAQEEVFIPLEMYNTSFNPIDKDKCVPTEFDSKRGLVKGIVHDEKACSMNGVSGHAGVFSNISDLMNYTSMVLNDGVYKDKRYLKKETIDLWFKNLVYEEKQNRTRSLCWITNNNDLVVKNRNNIISFNGFTGPSISIDRENNIGIILLTNRIHPTRDNKKISLERPIIYENIYNELNKNKIHKI